MAKPKRTICGQGDDDCKGLGIGIDTLITWMTDLIQAEMCTMDTPIYYCSRPVFSIQRATHDLIISTRACSVEEMVAAAEFIAATPKEDIIERWRVYQATGIKPDWDTDRRDYKTVQAMGYSFYPMTIAHLLSWWKVARLFTVRMEKSLETPGWDFSAEPLLHPEPMRHEVTVWEVHATAKIVRMS